MSRVFVRARGFAALAGQGKVTGMLKPQFRTSCPPLRVVNVALSTESGKRLCA